MCQTTKPPDSRTILDPATLQQTRERYHSRCVVCGNSNPFGLNVNFLLADDGNVTGTFRAELLYQGYDGLLHGGIIASLLDGAMTNCLFAHGLEALTAELTVRYRHPVLLDDLVTVRAWMERAGERLFRLKAELIQSACTKATAVAKFMPPQ